MRKLLLLLVLTGFFFKAHSQVYGNEWINYNQTYLKFRIATDGLYRIPYSTLQNFGVPVNTINGSNIEIFGRGKEVPIYVTTPGIFTTTDYIEFYAVHNDGFWDSTLYADHSWQGNDKLSFFTDSAYYYLTWSSTASINHYVNTANNIVNPPPSEPFCWFTSSFVGGKERSTLLGGYCRGAVALQGNWLWASDFKNTECYSDPFWGKSNKDFYVNTPHPYTSGPNVNLKTAIVGYGYGSSNYGSYDHYLVMNVNGNQIWSTVNNGFIMTRLDLSNISSSWLTAPTTTLEYSTAASVSEWDFNSVAWYDFKYPRLFDCDNASSFLFSVPSNGTNQYLTIGDFNEYGTTPILYDITNKLRLTAVVENDTEKFLLPSSLAPERQLLLIANDSFTVIHRVDSLWSVHFVDYTNAANQGNFILISNPKLMVDSSGNDYIEQYKNLKNQYGYTSIIANINDLYDQFAFGIRYHPAAIRKFAHYITDKWPKQDHYMFLIGKALEYPGMNDNPNLKQYDYVPTFGVPGSDELLTARGFSPRPLIPVGRLPVLTAEEIAPYLTKAGQFLAAQDSSNQTIAHTAWRKQVMHLCGGSNAIDQSYFGGILNNFKNIIEGPLFGAHVTSFYKDNDNPIELATNAQIDSLLQHGVSLITFFGHSSYYSLDFNLDRPEDYHNDGKYPLLLTNGCLIGNLFTLEHGMSDKFVLADHCGAIGFIGPSIFSVASSLDAYSSAFYNNLGVHEYNKPIGAAIQQAISDVAASGSDIDKATAEQMLLAGDPSLRLNTHFRPDYDLEPQNVTVYPSNVSAGLDSFQLQVVTFNLGKATTDSIFVDVKRTLPNGTEEFLFHKKVRAPYYNDTLRFTIKTEPNLAFGLNHFYVKVDAGYNDSSANGDIAEISEMNNTLGDIPLFINSDDIIPVWPYDYSIVSAQGVTLKASTVNAFAPAKQYVFQIDTTQFFNSPLLQTKKIVQIGGVVKWTPMLTMQDSTVYYWRTSVDTLYGAHDFTWHNASFIYLHGSSPGWNQSHYFQFLSTIQGQGNIVLPSDRIFKYVDDIKTVNVYNGFSDYVGGPVPYNNIAYYLNGVRLGKWDCAGCGSTILIAVIDSSDGIFWGDTQAGGGGCSPASFGSIQCHGDHDHPDTRPYFFYNSSVPYNDAMSTFLRDSIPDGDYILLMSMNFMYATYSWDSNQKQIFTDLGLSQIVNVPLYQPYVGFFRKHDPTYPIYEITGDTFTSIIDTSFTFTGKWDDGYIESPLIGPAASWSALHWKAHSLEANTDNISLQIIGVNNAGTETVLANNVLMSDTAISGINVNEYPYLRLKLNCQDTSKRTPIQLDYWRINYQPVPEAALNPALHFSLNDTVNQFSPLKLSCAVENISPWNMDSMLMKYEITDATNGLHSYSKRYKPLAGNDTMNADFIFDTGCDCFAGLNYLYVEANPNSDQPEQYHFNNIGITSFHELSDNLNPILDVTFDGVHIMDDDLVSAKPDIQIMLKDENKFAPLNDTSEFKIYFTYPDGSQHTVTFDNVHAFFYPADSTSAAKDNTARVELKQEFLVDGKYQLIVQGYDRGGNSSGDNAYRISFEVINKPMISNVLNYPNPFTTSTRFVFTLTGYETPQQMKVTIYTITGKVVKELFLGELGNIRVGNNITEYAFDGTDQFGDKLANGLYFYRVEAILNGKSMDHYDTGTDQFFKKGIGKMYLMR